MPMTTREGQLKVVTDRTLGPLTLTTAFHVIDIVTSFNLLSGRPWLHEAGAVASTYHQCLKFPFQGSIIKVSAEVQPALTADCENVGFMPSIEIGGQFVPLETMGMSPSRSVSVLDINFPRSYPFGTPKVIRREEDPATLASCLKMSRKRSKPRLDGYKPYIEAWRIMLQQGYKPRKGLGAQNQGIVSPIKPTSVTPNGGLGWSNSLKEKGEEGNQSLNWDSSPFLNISKI